MLKKTKIIKVGNILIGGGNPVVVQSMTKTPTRDVEATVAQIRSLEEAGCQIVRIAVPHEEDAWALKDIRKQVTIPLVADIHFNHTFALAAIEAGFDKIRINPGNIGNESKVRLIVDAAKEKGIPIRVGVNSGSLELDIRRKYKHVTADALVESALKNIRMLEKFKFTNIAVSVKSTSVLTTIQAYRKLSHKVDYPLHIGMTEAGIPKIGIIRSSIGIGALLADGIGDTIRVSLTSDPVEEVKVAFDILKSLEMISRGVTILSCPTCGRCSIDVERIASEVYERTNRVRTPMTVAIMGCEVNGPGEAADADVGLAGGNGVGLIFREGTVVRKVPEDEMVDALVDEIESMAIK